MAEVETYVSFHQNKVSQFITTRPIMELCLAEDRNTVVMGGQSVVETGQLVLGRDVDGGSRGGMDGGEEDMEMMVTEMD